MGIALPSELTVKILTYLNAAELIVFGRVSKWCYELANDSTLWRSIYENEFGERLKSIKQKGLPNPSHWKRFYLKSRVQWTNACTRVMMLEGHRGPINCIDSDEDFILSGSNDTTIRIWDVRNGFHNTKCIHTLKSHVGSIFCLKYFTKNFIVSGSEDLTVKLWRLNSGEVTSLYTHGASVLCIHHHDNLVVTGSRDQTVKVFDLNSSTVVQRFMTESKVYSVTMHHHQNILGATGEGSLILRDKNTERTLHSLRFPFREPMRAFEMKGNYIVLGNDRGQIYFYDLRNMKQSVKEHSLSSSRTMFAELHFNYNARHDRLATTFGSNLRLYNLDQGFNFKDGIVAEGLSYATWKGVKSDFSKIVMAGADYRVGIVYLNNKKN